MRCKRYHVLFSSFRVSIVGLKIYFQKQIKTPLTMAYIENYSIGGKAESNIFSG